MAAKGPILISGWVWSDPQSDLSSDWPELDMPVHKQCLLGPIDARSLILKFRSKMVDWQEIRRFLILNIWTPFNSQISAMNDLSWKPYMAFCLVM